jgi:hypothetical protein
MTLKVVTSLSFRGQCREAFEFYAAVLGGKITTAMPYGDAPPGMPITDESYKTWLMHCWLEVGDQALMGADMDVGWAPTSISPRTVSTSPCTQRIKPRVRVGTISCQRVARPSCRSTKPSGHPASVPLSTSSAFLDDQHHPVGRLDPAAGLIGNGRPTSSIPRISGRGMYDAAIGSPHASNSGAGQPSRAGERHHRFLSLS